MDSWTSGVSAGVKTLPVCQAQAVAIPGGGIAASPLSLMCWVYPIVTPTELGVFSTQVKSLT